MRPARACRPGGSLGFVFFPPRHRRTVRKGVCVRGAAALRLHPALYVTRSPRSVRRRPLTGSLPHGLGRLSCQGREWGTQRPPRKREGRRPPPARPANPGPRAALRFLCAAHRSVSRPPVCLSTLGGPFLTPQSGVQLAHSVCWRVRPQGRGPHTACAPRPLPPPGRGWHCTPWRRPAWAASPAPRAAVPSGSGRSPASPPVQAARACLLPGAFGA